MFVQRPTQHRHALGKVVFVDVGVGPDALEQFFLGDDTAGDYADRLFTRFPDDALKSIRIGLVAATDSASRAKLIKVTGLIHTSEATALLQTLVDHAPDLPSRIAAAECLRDRSDIGYFPVLVQQWQTGCRLPSFEGPARLLAEFLTSTGDARSVRAIAGAMPLMPVNSRASIMMLLITGDFRNVNGSWGISMPRKSNTSRYAAVEREVEALVAKELLDRSFCNNECAMKHCTYHDARLCDIAADALSSLFPIEYSFLEGANLFESDSHRYHLYNRWLSRTGRGSVAMPEDSPLPLDERRQRFRLP